MLSLTRVGAFSQGGVLRSYILPSQDQWWELSNPQIGKLRQELAQGLPPWSSLFFCFRVHIDVCSPPDFWQRDCIQLISVIISCWALLHRASRLLTCSSMRYAASSRASPVTQRCPRCTWCAPARLDDFCKDNIRCAACFLPELSLPMSCPSGGAVFCSLVFRIWNTWCSVSFMVCFFPLFWRIFGTSEHGLCEGKGLICRRRTSEDQDGKHLSQSERLQWERTAELCAPWWPAYW